MKNKIIAVTLILLVFSIVYGRDNELKISHVGYYNNAQQLKFTIHNLGDETLHNLSYYIDGELVRERETVIGPNQGISTGFNLEPGEHLIEVRSLEGAYGSITVQVSPTIGDSISIAENISSGYRNIILIGVLALILIVIWILMKRPKLDL